MNKEKQERFYKVAELRTNKIIQGIRTLSKCSKLNCYEYTEHQVARIFKIFQEELDKAKELFKNKGQTRVLGDYCLSPEPYTDLHLPNGDMLRAIAYDDPDFPTINIQLFEGGITIPLRFALLSLIPKGTADHRFASAYTTAR